MLKVLQANVHLGICGGGCLGSVRNRRSFLFLNRRPYSHLPCFLFSSISILFSRRFSSLTFFCLMRFLLSSSSTNLEGKRPSVTVKRQRLENPHPKTCVPTCEGVQSDLGQDRRLQGQLAHAELAGERQVSQIAMTATDLLQRTNGGGEKHLFSKCASC